MRTKNNKNINELEFVKNICLNISVGACYAVYARHFSVYMLRANQIVCILK